jgi:hypothetical protein
LHLQLGAGSARYATPFRDQPDRLLKLVEQAETLSGHRFHAVTLSAWSAGYGAVREILRHEPSYGRVAGVLLLDGLHTGYVDGQPGPRESPLETEPLEIFVRLARDAVDGHKRFVITHSEVFPGTYASTTETADYLLQQLELPREAVLRWGPQGMQQLSDTRRGQFAVLGFAGNSAPDHVDHLHGLADFWQMVDPGLMERVRVSDDGQQFVRGTRNAPFRIWGVNYDHDTDGRLIEDYWFDQWQTVVADFDEIKQLGANCVRIHLQFGKFMEAPNQPNLAALQQLGKLVKLAEQTGLYLNLTGLGCYHAKDVPAWYDKLDEQQRWIAQAAFWQAVARTCKDSPAIFCYDLMNEPIVTGSEPATEWLAGELAGKHFVQRLTLDRKGRTPSQIADAWAGMMVAAIREHDRRTMITVGVIPWVFVFGGGKPLFYEPPVANHFDFVSIHVYPEAGAVPKAIEALKAYDVGKPLVIEEMFPLKCSAEELTDFIQQSADRADGWFSFYWGRPASELRAMPDKSLADAISADWLERFSKLSASMKQPAPPP